MPSRRRIWIHCFVCKLHPHSIMLTVNWLPLGAGLPVKQKKMLKSFVKQLQSVSKRKKKGGKESTVSQMSSHIVPPSPYTDSCWIIREIEVVTYSASTQFVTNLVSILNFPSPFLFLCRSGALCSSRYFTRFKFEVRTPCTVLGISPPPHPINLISWVSFSWRPKAHTSAPFRPAYIVLRWKKAQCSL